MTQWHPIAALDAFKAANAKKRVTYFFYYPAIKGSRHSSNDKPEWISMEHAHRRDPSKFAVIELPELETVNGQ
jgi:hypothetical protein